MNKSHQKGLIGLVKPARENHFHGFSGSHKSRKALGSSSPRDYAHLDLGQSNSCIMGHDPEIAGHSKLESAAKAKAVNGRDKDERALFKPVKQGLDFFGKIDGGIFVTGHHFNPICTADEIGI